MADAPHTTLHFKGACPDCGVREVHLPEPLPPIGDDFDFLVRDYDGFRIFMLEELSARFPERKRWTPADLEVVLVEVFATVLDQLSDMTDRVASEVFLETARRPERVRELLAFIGYDAINVAESKGQIKSGLPNDAAEQALDKLWRNNRHLMNKAKREGPRSIQTQKRMVTINDYAIRLIEHPIVAQAHAWKSWGGSWNRIQIATIAFDNIQLDEKIPLQLASDIESFHLLLDIPLPRLDFASLASTEMPSVRVVLDYYLNAFRMVGQQVILRDPIYIGIYLSISIKIKFDFFQSEIKNTISQVLGSGTEGFFEAGNLSFGEDLYASDVIKALMSIDGIAHVCLNSFKRIGSQYPERKVAGFIALEGLEVAVCDNNGSSPERGFYRIKLHGGLAG